MLISEIRKDVQNHLAGFLWTQWAQMGVFATTNRRDRWAADPEALLLLTFEVGRDEPRLFDEVLDWLAVNERLISIQRLRNLARDEKDRALVEAVVGWLGERRRRARLEARSAAAKPPNPEPFFRNSRLPTDEPDPAFLAQGLLKPSFEPSGKSQSPQVLLPINLAFRFRLLMGIGARAEAMRVLLTIDAPRSNVQAIASSTAYTKRNVQEAVSSLSSAGVLDAFEVGNEQRFSAPRDRWMHFLTLDDLPRHEDWPQVFAAYRKVLRWLADPAHEELSDYMLSSEARTLAEEVTPDLHFAGITIDSQPDDSSFLERFIRQLLERAPV
jgi:predicted pyridoxine 5'-phosphate oxidase superfamily flavin-nucleotide-binding protein